MKIALTLTTLVAALAPAAAHAATPVTAGTGNFPDVAVDAAGTAHLVWDEAGTGTTPLSYCRIPRGGTACEGGLTLAPPLEAIGRSSYVFVPGPGRVVIATHRCCGTGEGVWAYQSTDGGNSFDAGRLIGDLDFGQNAVFGPGEAITGSDTRSVQVMPLDGAPATAEADLEPGFAVPTFGSVALFEGTTPVHAASDNADMSFNRYRGSGDPNSSASWTPATQLGQGDEVRLAGGSGGLVALYVSNASGARQLVARKFDGTNFGAPVAVSQAVDPVQADLYADPDSGDFHALWVSQDGPVDEITLASSKDGVTWTAPQTIVRGGEIQDTAFHLQLAVAPDGQGWGVFDENTGGRVRAVPLVPGAITGGGDGSSTKAVDSVTVGGVKFTLTANAAACVQRGAKLRLRVTSKLKRRLSPRRRVKVRKATFSLDRKRKADRRAPFRKAFSTAVLAPGSTHRLKARIALKPVKGKGKTRVKTLKGSFQVCP